MSLLILPTSRSGATDFVANGFAGIAFELALQRNTETDEALETVVARAASEGGGKLLFVLPAAADARHLETIAAFRLAGPDGSSRTSGALLFVVKEVGPDGCVRLAKANEVDERIVDFASAYLRVMDRFVPGPNLTAAT